MTPSLKKSLKVSQCANRNAPAYGAVRFGLLAFVLTASTALALPVAQAQSNSVAQAQSNSNALRGTGNQGVGGNPAILLRPAGSTQLPGQLLPGQVIQGQGAQGQNVPGAVAQQALGAVTAASPFEQADEEEEAAARATPQSRVGPTQAFPDAEDEEEEGDDPFADPLPEPAVPLTEEELERERLARLRRVRAVEPVEPLQAGPDVEEEEDPYAPIGIQIGSFELRPTLDLGIAGTSRKAFRETGGTPPRIVSNDETGAFGEVDLGILARSNWARHSLIIEGNAKFQEGLSGNAEAEPELDLLATGVLNISQETTLTGEIDYAYVLEAASSANAENGDVDAIATAATPSQQTLAGLLTLGHDTGLLFGEVSGGITRSISGAVELQDGSNIQQTDNDNSVYTLGLRGGFRASPAFRPFLEGQLGWRVNDSKRDGSGIARDSRRYTLRLGTEVDLGEKLTGEVAIGYVTEDFDDASLSSLGGLSVAAELEWLPRRGTQVGVEVTTTTQSSGLRGVSGAVAYTGVTTVTQQIRRNLSSTFTAGLEFEDFNTIESDLLTATAGLGFTYWFNRGVGLVGTYSHERVLSDDPSQEQSSNSVFLGLRLQR